MSIEVTNVVHKLTTVGTDEFKGGVLYKLAPSEGDYSTIYTKATNGMIVWFEEGRVGVRAGDMKEKFVEAPAGTQVLLKA